jgi:hypothetical protein
MIQKSRQTIMAAINKRIMGTLSTMAQSEVLKTLNPNKKQMPTTNNMWTVLQIELEPAAGASTSLSNFLRMEIPTWS